METTRDTELYIEGTPLQLPCFFPSVSSVRTNLKPVDYIDLLDSSGYPLFLISAYDLAHCSDSQRQRVDTVLKQSKERGSVILMDSGNYESFWKTDKAWQPDNFHKITGISHYHLCFCYDNQDPPSDSKSIAKDVVSSVLRDRNHALGTVIPIVHGSEASLPDAVRMVAAQLQPILVAVPERELGEGIIKRTQTVRKIRKTLNTLGTYYPLHLLGTGNPLSIITYALAGADSFDGLEWCQTTVDHKTGKLLHFQQWDLIRHQTEWGESSSLPYTLSVLMHNLDFYEEFTANLREAIHSGYMESFIRHYATDEQIALLTQIRKKDD